MVLLQINFDFPVDMMGASLVKNAKPLAESINNEEGFISKVWIENPETGRSGGIYLFDKMINAKRYAEMHSERVKNIGATNILCEYFEVNIPLSEINKGV